MAKKLLAHPEKHDKAVIAVCQELVNTRSQRDEVEERLREAERNVLQTKAEGKRRDGELRQLKEELRAQAARFEQSSEALRTLERKAAETQTAKNRAQHDVWRLRQQLEDEKRAAAAQHSKVKCRAPRPPQLELNESKQLLQGQPGQQVEQQRQQRPHQQGIGVAQRQPQQQAPFVHEGWPQKQQRQPENARHPELFLSLPEQDLSPPEPSPCLEEDGEARWPWPEPEPEHHRLLTAAVVEVSPKDDVASIADRSTACSSPRSVRRAVLGNPAISSAAPRSSTRQTPKKRAQAPPCSHRFAWPEDLEFTPEKQRD